MKTKRGAPQQRQPAKNGKRLRATKRGAPEDAAQRDPRRRGEAKVRKDPRRRPEMQSRTRDQRTAQHGPATTTVRRPARPKNTSQAKARAKARKAKAPKVVRPPLRERLLTRIAAIDLNPRTLAARVPFVVLVIGALGVGLGVTLWLSTDAAERSYQLGNARATNQALLQQKEALERDVLEAQAAPALAEAARNLGMIPSKDTAHLVQDPAGNWFVVGQPKPAEGVPPPPLNTPLPDPTPARPAAPENTTERPVRLPSSPLIPGLAAPAPPPAAPLAGADAPVAPEVLVRAPEPEHAPAPGPAPDHATAPGPVLGPADEPALISVPPAAFGTPPGPAVAAAPAQDPLPQAVAPQETPIPIPVPGPA